MTYQDERIIQVLDYIAGNLPGKKINKLTALKLVYLADRYHLRKYATPILWDSYYAMKYGPVASRTKRLIEDICTNPHLTDYISVEESACHTQSGSRIMFISSSRSYNAAQISTTEKEALDSALAQWSLHDNLVDFTHLFPEWQTAKARIDNGARRVRMDYSQFFNPCSVKGCEYCDIPDDTLALNREVFAEEASFRGVRI